jgi:hypothetical protein
MDSVPVRPIRQSSGLREKHGQDGRATRKFPIAEHIQRGKSGSGKIGLITRLLFFGIKPRFNAENGRFLCKKRLIRFRESAIVRRLENCSVARGSLELTIDD